MEIRTHYNEAKRFIDLGMIKLNSDQDDGALNAFAAAYTEVRELLDHAWRLKYKKALESAPPGGN